MKAILFADRNGEELQPLTTKTCVALLPMATKPLIEYTLDELLSAHLQEVIVVISAHAEDIEQRLGNGERWGMQLDYVLTRGQEEPATILSRLGAKLTDTEYLLIRGDILRGFKLRHFLKQASLENGTILAVINDHNAGVCLVRKQASPNPWQASNLLRWNVPAFLKISSNFLVPKTRTDYSSATKAGRTNNFAVTIDHGQLLPWEGNLSLLDSLQTYHQANIDVLAGHFPPLVVPGKQVNDSLRVGRRSTVREGNVGLIGAYCQIHSQAFLLDKVVVSNEVIIDRQAILQNTVVLPDTYVGEAVELRNAIVWGNLLIRVDTGAIVQVIDSFLLADLKTETISKQLAGLINRSLGLLTLLISLPLWPVAWLIAWLQNPQAPLRQVKLRGNLIWRDSMGIAHPKDFIALEWATNIILLRHLPKLLAVITGQLRMVGVSPELPEQAEARTAPWEKVRDDAPIGLIGPSQLTIPMEAPTEERLIAEAYYARTRHFGTDLMWLVRGIVACFSKRAWSAETKI